VRSTDARMTFSTSRVFPLFYFLLADHGGSKRRPASNLAFSDLGWGSIRGAQAFSRRGGVANRIVAIANERTFAELPGSIRRGPVLLCIHSSVDVTSDAFCLL